MPSSLLLPVLLLAATAATTSSLPTIPGCQGLCGSVEIPYPFGIGTGCSRKGFEIACITNGSAGEIPVLATTDQTIRVLHLSVSPSPEARVLLPVAWQCFNSTGYVTGSYMGDVNFNPEGVYRISSTRNELFVLGCNTFIYASGVRWHTGRFRYKYYTGCVAFSNDMTGPSDGACAGLGCCRVDIPPGFTDTTMTMSTGGSWTHANQEFCPCDYAFIVEKGNYTFKASDLLSTHIPNNQTMPLSVDWTMPLSLDWAIRDNGSTTSISCAQAPSKPDHEYACRSNHSDCINSTNGPGYFCNCTKGYGGNPYIVGGCTNINECQFSESYSCPSGSNCIDTDGGYKCQCKLFRRGEDCRPIIPTTAVALLATSVAVVTACFAVILLQTLKQRKLFNINGGDVLKGAGISIFTKRELKKITNSYSNRIGGGFFGDVYKGTIIQKGAQAQDVAVKCTVAKKEARRRQKQLRGDEAPQHEQDESWKDWFVNEITIQFQIKNPNIVRLVGCCLEADVPILVFEFINNGSLHDKLHDAEKRCPLSLLQRLNIAIGSAKALSYMHSRGNQNRASNSTAIDGPLEVESMAGEPDDCNNVTHLPVTQVKGTTNCREASSNQNFVHCDIKPANILLDGDFEPKVSDFGSSKLLSGKTYAKYVAVDGNYADPEYNHTGRFTVKSDVYSFGMVLLELITRKTPSYGENGSLYIDFKKSWDFHDKRKRMYDAEIISDGDLITIKCIDMVGKLALECLNGDSDKRPTMGDVEVELEKVKSIACGGLCCDTSENAPLLAQPSDHAGSD